MGIASMVIGIVALIVGFIPLCGTWAVVPAVVGLALGVADLIVRTRRGEGRGMAIAGMVLNPLAIIVIVLWYFLFMYGATQSADWQVRQWPQRIDARDAGPSPFGPLQPMQQMQPMQPVDTDLPAQPDPAAAVPQPVPIRPEPAPSPP